MYTGSCGGTLVEIKGEDYYKTMIKIEVKEEEKMAIVESRNHAHLYWCKKCLKYGSSKPDSMIDGTL